MTMSRPCAVGWLGVALLLLGACTQPPTIPAKPKPSAAELAARKAADDAAVARAARDARVAEALRIAESAYLFGYPLITSEVVRQQMSGVDKAEGRRAPPNVFSHGHKPGDEPGLGADAGIRVSVAWLDLEQGALMFKLPAIRKRYAAFTLHSLWMTELGAWVDGDALKLLISGPRWQGQVPKGVVHVRSPTRHAVLVGRISVNGSAADERLVRSLQQRLRLAPVTESGKPRKAAPMPSAGGETLNQEGSARQVVGAMDIATYFNLLASLLGGAAPPGPQDADLLQRTASLGIEPGKYFDLGALEPALQAALHDLGPRLSPKITARRAELYTLINGWQVPLPPDVADGDAMRRAAMAAFDWPGPVPLALMQLHTRVDGAGQPLSGAHDYALRFEKDAMPPVDGFWSLTMLAEDEAGRPVAVPNTYDRSSLDMRDELLRDADGSVTLRVQYFAPGYDRAANWLPAPKGDFGVMFRLYAPRTKAPSLVPPGKGGWAPPPLVRRD